MYTNCCNLLCIAVLLLKQKFPEPQKLVTDVFKPISEDASLKPPVFYLDKGFGNSIYKGRLEFQWPHAIKVSWWKN